MTDRLAHFTSSLRERTTLLKLAGVPALISQPEGEGPTPLLLWLHGRTANKELDAARYLRLIRAGIAVCAIDLPGHGEREDLDLHDPAALPDLLRLGLAEVDEVLAALREGRWSKQLRADRMAMGGMSAGGMITLRRLCDPHHFRCAHVESTAGDFQAAAGSPQDRWIAARMNGLDPALHLAGWAPLPLLALHSERDALAPVAGIRRFVERLRDHYHRRGADPELARLHTWPETGAPLEHAGFGRVAGESRKLMLAFLGEHLRLD